MKTLTAARDYQNAAEIADSINWHKIKNVNALMKAGEIYEKTGRYEESRELYLMAYDRSPVGRMIIYRLAEVSIRMGNYDDAKDYYQEFVEAAPHDNLRYVLQYELGRAQGADTDAQIAILEEFKEQEYTEEWAYELACLYHKAGMSEKCIEACDELILWFGDGPYVERALELKMVYQPLTKQQEEKYRQLRQQTNGFVEVRPEDELDSGEIVNEAVQIPKVKIPPERFNTQNLQEELQKSMQQIMAATEKEAVDDGMDNIKKLVEEIPYLQVPREEQQEAQEISQIVTDREIDNTLRHNFREYLGEDADGQMLMPVPEDTGEIQTDGQSIDSVLLDWEKTKRAAEAALAEANQKKLESAKARALREAGDIMERLVDAIPKLDSGLTPQQLLVEQYLGDGAIGDDRAAEVVASMNQILQREIERLSSENAQMDEQIAAAAGGVPRAAGGTFLGEAGYGRPGAVYGQGMADVVREDHETHGHAAGQHLPVAEIYENAAGVTGEEMYGSMPDEPGAGMYGSMPGPSGTGAYGNMPESSGAGMYAEPSGIPGDGMYGGYPENAGEAGMYGEPFVEGMYGNPSDLPGMGMQEMYGQEAYMETDQGSGGQQGMYGLPGYDAGAQGYEDSGYRRAGGAWHGKEEDMSGQEMYGNRPEGSDASWYREEAGIVRESEPVPDLEAALVKEAAADLPEDVRRKALIKGYTKEILPEIPLPDDIGLPEDVISGAGTGMKSGPEKLPDIREPEDVDGDYPAITRLSREQREIFTYFVPIRGMEQQLCQALTGAARHLMRGKTAATGNMVIQGGQGSGKTVLATGMIKALQLETGRPAGKVGRIEASVLNGKDLVALLRKVAGGCLIIEKAGDITRETAIRLSQLLGTDESGLFVILEDTHKGIEKALSRDAGFAAGFTEKINIPIFTSDELVSFARAYANELGYTIDEMGILALYNSISNIQKLDRATTLTEVKEIVDEAIVRVERGGLKKAFSIITSRRYDEEDYVILHEKDFVF